MKIFLLSLVLVLTLEPVFAQRLVNSSMGSIDGFSSLATRQYLSGKEEESLALYQKAIAKSENEYGKNSRVVATLNYELGVRALALSKFDLAEHSFKKAVEANPNCEAAQLMLVQLLRFRNKDEEAYYHTQQALKKHGDSMALRRDMVLNLQGRNPASATQQAYMISCLQNNTVDKMPSFQTKPLEKPTVEKTIDKSVDKSTADNPKGVVSTKNDIKDKTETKANPDKKAIDISSGKAIYQAINISIAKPTKAHPAKAIKRATRSRQSSNSAFGLVPPPPPPSALGFPVQSRSHAVPSMPAELKAKAESIKVEKPTQAKQSKHVKTEAPASEEAKKPSAEHASGDEDPDFLIEWASIKKKHGKQ